MPFIAPAAIVGGASLLGGYMQGEAAKNAANTSAQAQLQAAQIAADAAKFRPVGITTRYGTSNFQTDANGNLIGAGYTVSPELQAYQNQLQGLTQQQLQQGLFAPQQYAPLQTAAGGLFNLGQGYLAQSPEQAAQKYMENQQALLAPSRQQAWANLSNQLQNTGRTGLSVAQGGGLMSANPEASALANAQAMQDLQLAAGAQQAGQQQTAFGAGLFNTGAGLLGQYQQGQVGALSPFQTSLGIGGTIEQMGQSPLDIGAQLGGRAATAGAQAGNMLLQGGLSAAKTAQMANAYSPLGNVLQGIGSNPNIGTWLTSMPRINSMGNVVYNPATMSPTTQYGFGAGSLLSGTSGIAD